ncbi:MAG: 3-hydroxyacyl-ACP dehydratase FabZ [Gammaproteobacteria bacterium]|nr:3-hydroxyacyl-ACP dehydratase FabZ [Gammaproteobacteria bacterium]MCF6229826.1 3-hydroxyacyl-ACP dehydratase FabZ [Gammaproteobacteria bacterium]
MDSMDIYEVLKHLPHRYPFLMVDRVIECEPGKRLVAIKNVSFNEPYFTGHFPDKPVMPGVLILEALAQATGVLGFKTAEKTNDDGSLYLFVGIDNARFKRQVIPGDQLQLEVDLTRTIRNIWKFDTVAKVDGKVVASAQIMCAESEL